MEGITIDTKTKHTLVINLDQVKDYEIQLENKNYIFDIKKLFELGILIDKDNPKEKETNQNITFRKGTNPVLGDCFYVYKKGERIGYINK